MAYFAYPRSVQKNVQYTYAANEETLAFAFLLRLLPNAPFNAARSPTEELGMKVPFSTFALLLLVCGLAEAKVRIFFTGNDLFRLCEG
jgi:hypothetical protein